MGWAEEQEGIWFDSDNYTKEEAEQEFKEYHAISQRGYPYTGYEYYGERYCQVFFANSYRMK